MTTEKILDKIRKLLALATSDNVNEAATAAAQAQRLMTRHSIEQGMLDATDADFSPHDGIWEDSIGVTEARAVPWKAFIAEALGTTNACKVYWAGVPTRTAKGFRMRQALAIVGHQQNIATVRYMFGYLVDEVERLTAASEGSGLAWKNSFRLGASHVLSDRIYAAAEQAKRAMRKSHKGDALARVEKGIAAYDACKAAVDAYVARRLDLAAAPESKGVSDWEGYNKGQNAARRVALDGHKQLDAGKEVLARDGS